MRFHFVQFFGNIVGLCVAFKTGLIIHFSFRKIGPCIPSLASRIFENVLCRKVYILSPLIFTRSVYGRCFFFIRLLLVLSISLCVVCPDGIFLCGKSRAEKCSAPSFLRF